MSRRLLVILLLLSLSVSLIGQITVGCPVCPERKIKLANLEIYLVLDTSAEIEDELIDQLKSNIWNVVNELSTLKSEGNTPRIKIDVLTYQNDGAHISLDKKVHLNYQLDCTAGLLYNLLSYTRKFQDKSAIDDILKYARWEKNDSDVRLVYIIGKTSFSKGDKAYRKYIKNASEKDIYINTIYLGDSDTPKMWTDVALRTKGKFVTTKLKNDMPVFKTPYDDDIIALNEKLNDTYFPMRMRIFEKKMQSDVDDAAKNISDDCFISRIISKTTDVYDSSSWDLVDFVKLNKDALNDKYKFELSQEQQSMPKEELVRKIEDMDAKRTYVKNEIREIATKRQSYIKEQLNDEHLEKRFLDILIESVIEHAVAKGYTIED